MSEKEYKDKCESMFKKNAILINENEQLKQQIEKMKNCGNCKHQTPKTKDDFLFCCECKQLDEQKDNIILTKWELAE